MRKNEHSTEENWAKEMRYYWLVSKSKSEKEGDFISTTPYIILEFKHKSLK